MIELLVNGHTHSVSVEPDTPLLYVLRNELRLNGAKFGCGLGQCGACTVLVDGAPVLSCITPILLLAGRQITTVEALGTSENPGLLQQAFIEEQAAQCGYCIPGMMMRAHALLTRNPRATEAEVRAQLEPNLCRCGTHMRILRAVLRAEALMQGTGNSQPPAAGLSGSADGSRTTQRPDADATQDASEPEATAPEIDGWQRPAHSGGRERPER